MALTRCGGERAVSGVVERWIEKPPAATRRDWMKHKLRLALWRCEVQKARALYLEDRALYFQRSRDLRSLYDRWRAIAPTAAGQVRRACERYHEFHHLLSD